MLNSGHDDLFGGLEYDLDGNPEYCLGPRRSFHDQNPTYSI